MDGESVFKEPEAHTPSDRAEREGFQDTSAPVFTPIWWAGMWSFRKYGPRYSISYCSSFFFSPCWSKRHNKDFFFFSVCEKDQLLKASSQDTSLSGLATLQLGAIKKKTEKNASNIPGSPPEQVTDIGTSTSNDILKDPYHTAYKVLLMFRTIFVLETVIIPIIFVVLFVSPVSCCTCLCSLSSTLWVTELTMKRWALAWARQAGESLKLQNKSVWFT